MNTKAVPGKWTEIKGEIQNIWSKLTHDELERTKGDVEAIGDLIRHHYADSRQDVSQRLNSVIEIIEETIADKTEQINNSLHK
jgi:uncharacterized protein YjbJ (UPF0337 family)